MAYPEIDTWLRSLPSNPAERPMLGVVVDELRGVLPAGPGCLSTHILRPDLGHWHGAAFTEVFCQTLARRAGLPATDTELLEGAAVPCSLSRRYDIENGRKLKSSTFARRLNDDDAPLPFCFALIEEKSNDVRADQQVLMDMVLFNALIGNSLADARFFGMIEDEGGMRIAPLHGALCASIFPHLPQRFAMPIGHAREPLQLRTSDWERLAGHTQLEPASLATRALGLAERVRGESRGLAMSFATGANAHMVGIMLSSIEQNCMLVVQSLKVFLTRKAA